MAIPGLLFMTLAIYLMSGFVTISELFANATQFLLAGTLNIIIPNYVAKWAKKGLKS